MPCRDKKNDTNQEFWEICQTWPALFRRLLEDVSQSKKFQNEVEIADFLIPSQRQTVSDLDARLKNIRNWKSGTRPQRRSFQILTKQLEIKSGTALHDRWLYLYGASTAKLSESIQPQKTYEASASGWGIRKRVWQYTKSYRLVIAAMVAFVFGIGIFEFSKTLESERGVFPSPVDRENTEPIENPNLTQAKKDDIAESDKHRTETADIKSNMVERFSINGLRLGATADLENRYYPWRQNQHFPSMAWVRPLKNGHVAFSTHNNKIDGQVIAIARSFVIRTMEDEEFFEFLGEKFGQWDGLYGYRPVWKENPSMNVDDCYFYPGDSQVSILDTHASRLAKRSYAQTGYEAKHHPIKLDQVKNDCGVLAIAQSNRIGLASIIIVDSGATSKFLEERNQKRQEILEIKKVNEKSAIKFE